MQNLKHEKLSLAIWLHLSSHTDLVFDMPFQWVCNFKQGIYTALNTIVLPTEL